MVNRRDEHLHQIFSLFIVCTWALQTTYNNSLHCFEPQQSVLPKLIVFYFLILVHLLHLHLNSKQIIASTNFCLKCFDLNIERHNILRLRRKLKLSKLFFSSFCSFWMPGNIWKERKRKKTPRLDAIGIYTFAGENNKTFQ